MSRARLGSRLFSSETRRISGCVAQPQASGETAAPIWAFISALALVGADVERSGHDRGVAGQFLIDADQARGQGDHRIAPAQHADRGDDEVGDRVAAIDVGALMKLDHRPLAIVDALGEVGRQHDARPQGADDGGTGQTLVDAAAEHVLAQGRIAVAITQPASQSRISLPGPDAQRTRGRAEIQVSARLGRRRPRRRRGR